PASLRPAQVDRLALDDVIEPAVEMAAPRIELKKRQSDNQFGPYLLNAVRDVLGSCPTGVGETTDLARIAMVKSTPGRFQLSTGTHAGFPVREIELHLGECRWIAQPRDGSNGIQH